MRTQGRGRAYRAITATERLKAFPGTACMDADDEAALGLSFPQPLAILYG